MAVTLSVASKPSMIASLRSSSLRSSAISSCVFVCTYMTNELVARETGSGPVLRFLNLYKLARETGCALFLFWCHTVRSLTVFMDSPFTFLFLPTTCGRRCWQKLVDCTMQWLSPRTVRPSQSVVDNDDDVFILSNSTKEHQRHIIWIGSRGRSTNKGRQHLLSTTMINKHDQEASLESRCQTSMP